MKNQTIFAALLAILLPVSTITEATEEYRGTPVSHNLNNTGSQWLQQGYYSHVWFHSVDIELSGDYNQNGFYQQLYVRLDADTSMPYQQVFAEFSLQNRYGWEHIYYTSSVFELFRQSSNDWLAIDTQLQPPFATDSYWLTIRLYDAYDGYLLAEISGYDTKALADLRLEDYQRDQQRQHTTVEVQAGSTGLLLVFSLCLLAWHRRRVNR